MKKAFLQAFFLFTVFIPSDIYAQGDVAVTADSSGMIGSMTTPEYRKLIEEFQFDEHTLEMQEFIKAMQDPDVVILDLRSEEEYARGHVWGAKHLGADIKAEKLEALVPSKDTKILLYCSNSLMITRLVSLTDISLPLFKAHGYNNFYKLENSNASSHKDEKMIKTKLNFVYP
tara:strand:+ start:181 stop:699 length:519 start_codon:yes stop_codon:yes gene_type:complete